MILRHHFSYMFSNYNKTGIRIVMVRLDMCIDTFIKWLIMPQYSIRIRWQLNVASIKKYSTAESMQRRDITHIYCTCKTYSTVSSIGSSNFGENRS